MFALLILSLALIVRWLPEDYGHPGLRRLSHGLQVLAVWLGFELLTVEINDVFRARAATNGVTPESVFVEAMILSAASDHPVYAAGLDRANGQRLTRFS